MADNLNRANGIITFKNVRQILENKTDFGQHLDDAKLLLDLAGAFIGATTGAPVQVVIDALSQKSRIFDAGKRLWDWTKGFETPTYTDRVEKMRLSYSLIYYTAFFDTLDEIIPDDIRDKLNSLASEYQVKEPEASTRKVRGIDNDRFGIVLPNICFDLNEVENHLSKLYKYMTDRFIELAGIRDFAENTNDADWMSFQKDLEELPEKSKKRFHNQYLSLCTEFNEFYIFVTIEHERTLQSNIDSKYQSLVDIAMSNQISIEAGLTELKDLIRDMPHRTKNEDMVQVADMLRRHYQRGIMKPIIDSEAGDEYLTFPPIEEAFIPQSYKLQKFTEKKPLGIKEAWNELEILDNLTSFWARYLADIDSLDNILLILGEPGCGKSLLTRVVSARLSSRSSVVIRIPLREHDVDKGIESIICERLERDGDASADIKKFKWFAEEFPNDAITLIFDGYDEIQQATGKVYRQFLNSLKTFQEQCAECKRPVRIVVTSREALIDKAEIPIGTTVMRLLGFDDSRKSQFIRVWNEYNHDVFLENSLNDFVLPNNNHDIDILSRQPLLLTMLAIYDADFENAKNALSNDVRLERTSLYDRLLRRFIRRELRKGKRQNDEYAYDELDENDKDEMIRKEMQKLGIAALGMFVREKLSIRVGELDDDFLKLKVIECASVNTESKALRNAEVFLESFFFIHSPKSEKNAEDDKYASFEFLHKTFYEFLIADMVLESLMDAVDYLSVFKNSKKRGNEPYINALENLEALNTLYFPTLCSACLCKEPEIIKMIAEWKDEKKEQWFKTADSGDVIQHIDGILGDLFDRHSAFIQNGSYSKLMIIADQSRLPDRYCPQTCAVYLLNLLTTRILVGEKCVIDISTWSYISQYVKMNLPLPSTAGEDEAGFKYRFQISPSEETILSFMSLFSVNRKGNEVIFSRRQADLDVSEVDLIDARIELAYFMQDDIGCMLYALYSQRREFGNGDVIIDKLTERGMNLSFNMITTPIRDALNKSKYYSNSTHAMKEHLRVQRRLRDWFNKCGETRLTYHDLYAYLDILEIYIRIAANYSRNRVLRDPIFTPSLRKMEFMLRSAIDETHFNYDVCAEQVHNTLLNDVLLMKMMSIIVAAPPISMAFETLIILLTYYLTTRELSSLSINTIIALIERSYRLLIPTHALSPFKEWAYLIYSGFGERETSLKVSEKWTAFNEIIDSYLSNTTEWKVSAQKAASILKLLYYCGYTDKIQDVFGELNEINKYLSSKENDGILELIKIAIKHGAIDWAKSFLEARDKRLWYKYLMRLPYDKLFEWMPILRLLDCEEHDNDDISMLGGEDDLDGAEFAAFKYIYNTDGANINEKLLVGKRTNALRQFNYIIEESIDKAVDLLLLCCARRKTRAFIESDMIEACFNYALLFDDESVSPKLMKLISYFKKDNTNQLQEYFRIQLPYIQHYDYNLATVIKSSFNLS